MDIRTVGKEVRTRREALGLTQERLAKLARLSRQTVQMLEAGTIADLGFERVARLFGVLGLEFDRLSLEARKKKRGLWMAAKTSSVSYSGNLTEDMLEQTLATGQVPDGFEAHIGHLLDEAPVGVVVMAVEEAAAREHREPAEIWRNVAVLARKHSDSRREFWL
ncbi:helix-turn-helix domain-containing protein [Paraburkholderia sediminicola]|uniref:helix-turn-helix transcriptional regulator n=1 Tax=Paraburkholderia sediminicola TaxID=458836 RepID=UPI0038B97B1E